jgi:hypothetical protein
MEEHGSADEVARERKLMQGEQDAPMSDEAHDGHHLAEEVIGVLAIDSKAQRGLGMRLWWRAGS